MKPGLELPRGYALADDHDELEIPQGYQIAEAPADTPQVGMGEAFKRGFRGREEQRGWTARNIAEEVGQNALPLGAGVGTGLVTKSPALMAGATGAARAWQSNVQGKDLKQIAKDATLEASLNYVGAKYIAPVVSSGFAMLGRSGGKLLKYLGTNAGGIAKPAFEFAEQNIDDVGRYIGAAPAEADKIAHGIREGIKKAIGESESEYRVLIEAAKKNPKYAGKTFNLADSLGDDALQIADDFGFQSTPGLPADDAAGTFWKFADRVDNLTNANLDEVYRFQRQLNSAYRNSQGPLKAAFGKLKDKTDDVLGQEIEEIGKANQKWAAARMLEEEASKINKADDLIGYLNRVFKNPLSTQSKETLETVGQKVPEVGEQITQARAYNAGQAFTPLMRPLPQTGMGAEIAKGIGLGTGASVAALAFRDPLTAGAVAGGTAAISTLASPRSYYLALQASRALQGAVEPIARAGTPLYSRGLEEAYRRLRQ